MGTLEKQHQQFYVCFLTEKLYHVHKYMCIYAHSMYMPIFVHMVVFPRPLHHCFHNSFFINLYKI